MTNKPWKYSATPPACKFHKGVITTPPSSTFKLKKTIWWVGKKNYSIHKCSHLHVTFTHQKTKTNKKHQRRKQNRKMTISSRPWNIISVPKITTSQSTRCNSSNHYSWGWEKLMYTTTVCTNPHVPRIHRHILFSVSPALFSTFSYSPKPILLRQNIMPTGMFLVHSLFHLHPYLLPDSTKYYHFVRWTDFVMVHPHMKQHPPITPFIILF